jgi:hypothetical protein
MSEKIHAAATGPRPARDTLLQLVERSREFYFSPGHAMQLDVIPSDAPEQGCRLHFGATLDCTPIGDASAAAPAPIAATMKLPASGLHWMLFHSIDVDTRSAALMAACGGAFELGGARAVAEFWVQLLKRPRRDQMEALKLARRHAPLEARERDFEDAAENLEDAVLDAISRRSPRRLRNAVSFSGGDCARLRAGLPAGMYSNGSPAAPDVVDAIRWPDLPAEVYTGAQVWAGQREEGPLSRLHCDVVTSLLAHLEGCKHVLLYSPRDHDKVYAVESFNAYQPCRVDARKPDLARFPLFAQARPAYVELLPGDLLVIPTGWFHYVWADGPVSSVSRFVRDALVSRLSPARAESSSH